MSGEQAFDNLANEDLKIWTEGYIAGADAERQQNAALKESLAELIKIVEYYHDNQVTYTEMPYKNWATAIEHAKKLLNKQPQSESDKTE